MDKIQEQIQEQSEYTSMQEEYEDTNLYELTPVCPGKEDKRDEQQYSDTVCSTRGGLQSGVPPPTLPLVHVSAGTKSLPDTTNNLHHKSSSWSKPLLFISILLCLILILLIIILGIVVHNKDYHANTATGTSEWADRIVQNVYDKLSKNPNISRKIPDFNEWANGVVSKVNSNVTGSLPDFNEWANGVVSKVNSNVTRSLPDFNEWANGVVSKVNSNVTGNLPHFNEWANGVSQNTFELLQNNTNFTELDKQILQTTRDSAQKLINIVNALSNLQDTSTSTAGVVDDILLIAQELLVLHNDSTALPTSCKKVKRQHQTTSSGYYILASANGTAYTAYCAMYERCGSSEGWTRIAYLGWNPQSCPSGFRLYQSEPYRACGRPVTSSGSCASVQFPSNGISYSQICGRVTGYQYGHTDAIYQPTYYFNHNDLNSYYVDGVSITRGSPRQHVWTLMAGESETSNSSNACPCNTGSSVSVESFIGNNYFCESGTNVSSPSTTLYTSDPLWDGQGCRYRESPCCNVTGIPWFHRDYGSTTTTDYIELRVCADEGTDDEDIRITYYQIYVK